MNGKQIQCPDCKDGVTRREFLTAVGSAIAAASLGGLSVFDPLPASAAPSKSSGAESFVKMLYGSLTGEQKKVVALPWSDRRRLWVGNNWRIVEPGISDLYTRDQQEMIRSILKNATSEVGYEKLQKQMRDDYGGFGNYTCCIFGNPEKDQFMWVMTGRHLTLRADGNSTEGVVFGGPIFYGHAVEFNERPDHPGNIWWHQARLANKVFDALDGKQRHLALVGEAPPDTDASIRIQGAGGRFTGIPVSELSSDQMKLLEEVTRSLLEPYRKEDVAEAIALIRKNGGWEKCYLSFYRQGDLGNDKVWDRWKLEGPAFAWYFRGSPHVHTWVNVAAVNFTPL